MTGGGGSDTFVFTAGESGSVLAGQFDSITGFILADGTGPDTLNLAGAATKIADQAGVLVDHLAVGAGPFTITATSADGIITIGGADSSEIDSLAEYVNVAKALTTGAAETSAFVYSGDTYVYQNNGGPGADLLIKLTGITTADALATSGTGANDILIG
jgi:hypothetical protein